MKFPQRIRARNLKFGLLIIPMVAVLNLLSKLPVYPDEEQWLYVNSRQQTDGTMQYLFPVCTEGFRLSQPVIWLPIRFIEWLTYSRLDLINNIRLVGAAQGIILLIVLRIFVTRFAKNEKIAGPIVFSGLLLGLLPFLLILNRPEQLLIILFLVSLIAADIISCTNNGKILFLNLTWFIFLILSLPAIHAKGTLFTVIAVAFFLIVNFQNQKISSMIIVILGSYSSIISMGIWSKRTHCPESKFLSQVFSDITLNPTQLDGDSLKKIAGNIIRTPKYILHLFYQDQYQSDWLAQRNSVGSAFQILANLALLVAVLIITYAVVQNFRRIGLNISLWGKSEYLTSLFLLTIISLAVLQRTKNFYDSYLPAVMFLLAGTLSISSLDRIKYRKVVSLSLVLTLLTTPAFFQTVSALPKSQKASAQVSKSVLISECRISKEQLQSGGFILDSSLIKLFWDTPRTIYSGYIWGWWGQDVDDTKLIARLKPSAIIVINDGSLEKEAGDVEIGDYICRNVNIAPN